MMRALLSAVLLFCCSTSLAQPPPPPPPPPLGPPPQPPGNPVTLAKANLGKALFFDEQLSSTRTVACATCHQASQGGTDPRTLAAAAAATHPGPDLEYGTADDVLGSPGVPLHEADGTYAWSPSFGVQPQVTSRKSPATINAAYAPLLFWDGRAAPVFTDPVSGTIVLPNGAALESQAVAPILSSAEMAHVGRTWEQVVDQLRSVRPLALSPAVPAALATWIAGRTYAQLFEEAFGTPEVTAARIGMAIASYERTLFSNQTPFDAAAAGQPGALTPQEASGRNLFGLLGCAVCHAGSLLSDNVFHYIGVRPSGEDLGRFALSGNPADIGAFRTPSLRNVALRAPYMHGGQFATLEEVVDFYDRGGDFDAPNKSPLVRPLDLTAQQKADLVAFLRRPLTDARVAAQTSPFDPVALYGQSSRVPRVFGTGVAGTDGFVPQVEAIEPPVAGNPNFTVALHGALGATTAVLVIDSEDPGTGPTIPAMAAFARVAVAVQGVGAGAGFASTSFFIADGPGLVGAAFTGRWFVIDPGAAGGVAVSPAFRFTIFGPQGSATDVASSAPPAAARLLPNVPNPFNPSTTIRYELAEVLPVRLAVYAVTGQRVRTLVESATRPAGTYEVRWDGRDDAGARAASGVYLMRLDAGPHHATRRAVLLQ